MSEPHELDGLIPEAVGETLAAYAATVPLDLAIVEIGSYKGRSTAYLARGAMDGHGARVYAIDPWDLDGNENGRFGFAELATREAFDRQLRAAGVADQVTPIQGFSQTVARDWATPVGLLFVDGDHSEQAVHGDYEAWSPQLVEGATVIFDDLDTARNPGVRRALETLGLTFDIEAERLAVVRV